VSSITAVQPLHVAAWIETQTRTHAAPTVKQQLAALPHLFDWLEKAAQMANHASHAHDAAL
jgi:hypothetical protein